MTCSDSPGTAAYDNLVQLAVALRPHWQAPGVKAAIRKALDRADAFTFADLCFAVAYVCADTDVKTPAPLAHDGPWWPKPTTMPTTLAAPWDGRCSVCSYPEVTCRRLYDDHEFTPNAQKRRGVETPAELDQKAREWFAEARHQAAAARAALADARQQTAPEPEEAT
jgi:hypothetical protein